MAVRPATVMRANGLSLAANELGATDPGDLVKAENCVVSALGWVTCRPGQNADDYELPAAGRAGTIYDDTKIVQCGTDKLVYDSGSAYVEYDGDFTPPDPDLIRTHFATALLNLYLTTSQGVQRLDQVAGTPTLAGVYRPKDFFSAAVNATTGGWLGPGQSAAYRATLCKKDSHGNVVESAPNGMIVVTNTQALVAASGTLTIGSPSPSSGVVGGTINGTTVTVTWGTSDPVTAAALAAAILANGTLAPNFTASALSNVVTITCLTAGTAGNATTLVKQGTNVVASGAVFTGGVDGDSLNTALTIPLGTGAYSTAMFLRLYRSVQFPGGTTAPTTTVTPADVEYLIAERYLTTAQLSNALISYTDTTPDEFLTVPLYSNSLSGNGESLSQANATPPWCRDVCWWDDAMWFASVKQRPAVTLQILGTGDGQDGVAGVRPGDVLTIAGWSFTAGTAYDLTTLTFKVFTDSDDAAVNVESTTRSLINVINQNQTPPSYETSPTLQATYLGIPGQTYGIFRVEGQALDAEQFHVTLTTQTITSDGITGDGAVSIIDTVTDHDFVEGDEVYLYSATPLSGLPNGTYTVLGTGLLADSFRVTSTQSGGSAVVYTAARTSPAPAFAWNPAPPPSFFDVAVGGLTRSGSIVTVTCDREHGLRPGDTMPIAAVAAADANYPAGSYVVVTTPTTTTYTYSNAGTTVASLTAYQSGSRVLSDNSDQPHVALRSKTNLPEAVPVAGADNLWPIGVPGKTLYRLVPEKDFLYGFKEEGVYVASIGAPYRFTQIDSTVHILAPDTAAACNGNVYALTNKGVVECAPNGCVPISGQIDTDLFQYFGPSLDSVRVNAFAHVDETKGIYVLQMPALVNSNDVTVRDARQYVYNVRAKRWTTWELDRAWGTFRQSDNVMVVGGTDTKVYVSRNTQQARDFSDDSFAVEVTAWDGDTLTLTLADASDVEVGDAIESANPQARETQDNDVRQTQDGDTRATQGVDPTAAVQSAIVVSIDGNDVVMSGGDFSGSLGVAATGHYTYISGTSGSVSIGGFTVNWSGGTAAAAVTSLASAINTDPDVSLLMVAAPDTDAGTVHMTAVTVGVAGNAIVTGPTGGPGGMHAGSITLTGGVDGAATVYEKIRQRVKWRTLVAPSPANWQTGEFVHWHFRNRSFYKGTLTLTTDQDSDGNTIDLFPNADAATGLPAAYTADPAYFPGFPIEPVKSRRPWPDIGPAAYLNVEWELDEAFAVGALNGLTMEIEAGSSESQYT